MGIFAKTLAKVITQEMIDKAIAKTLGDTKADKETKDKLMEEISRLKKEKVGLNEECENLKLDKKIELRDLEHMVKVVEEKNAIELERKTVELEGKYQKDKMEMLNENHSKLLSLIENSKKDLAAVYGEILKRLPNVNMEIKKGR